jgi:hypothetical protein
MHASKSLDFPVMALAAALLLKSLLEKVIDRKLRLH